MYGEDLSMDSWHNLSSFIFRILKFIQFWWFQEDPFKILIKTTYDILTFRELNLFYINDWYTVKPKVDGLFIDNWLEYIPLNEKLLLFIIPLYNVDPSTTVEV